MLKDLPFEGTIKVRNKGVDVAILSDSASVDMVFKASRSLVVCGTSTAVLEVTCLDPVDLKTLSYYEETTKALIAMNTELYNAILPCMKEADKLMLFEGETEKDLFRMVRKI